MTIRMIAERCGCSTATVSKALNGAGDVSRETAERVRRVAAELGYMPNAAARALKTSRSYCFGMLFQDEGSGGLGHGFFAGILNGFRDRAAELGYDIFFISGCLGHRKIGYVEHARYRGCDGVFIPNEAYEDPGIRELAASGIPLVTVDYAYEGCGSVLSDNVKGMADLVRYIYSMGHRRIAFIHGEDTYVTRIRVRSFRDTCEELGLEVPEEYLMVGKYCRSAASEEATRRLLALEKPPTCIIYPDDIAYLGGRNEIYRQGLRIPEDISAAGYDGIDFIKMLRPSLTTMWQDAELIGVSAADELARAVEQGRGCVPRQIIIPGKLLPGETVGRIPV